MVRLRSDLVLLAPVPLVYCPALAASSNVYVPVGGMTADPAYRCMNDQVLLCPRQLCRSYYKLLELFTSPLCNATAIWDPSRSIFASSSQTPNGQLSAPPTPYVLPLPVRGGRLHVMGAQWYYFARYVQWPGLPCADGERDVQCCGAIREMWWPYAIWRYNGNFECNKRVFRSVPHAFRQATTVALENCNRLEQADRNHTHAILSSDPGAGAGAGPRCSISPFPA